MCLFLGLLSPSLSWTASMSFVFENVVPSCNGMRGNVLLRAMARGVYRLGAWGCICLVLCHHIRYRHAALHPLV